MELNKPSAFMPNKNQIAKDWRIWKQEFLTYLKLSGGYEKFSEEDRAFLLINLMGTEAVKAMDLMMFDNSNDKIDMDILITKFDHIFDPPSNEVEERYHFFSRSKYPNETIDNYIFDLQEKSKKCNFGRQVDKFIMDMVILSMDNHSRHMIFEQEDLTLSKIIENYKQYVTNGEKMKEISENNAANLRAAEARANNVPLKTCWRCNTRHQFKRCPAYEQICNVCNEENHLNGLCREKPYHFNKEYSKLNNAHWKTKNPFRQSSGYQKMYDEPLAKVHSTNQSKAQNGRKHVELENNSSGDSLNLQAPREENQNLPPNVCPHCKSNSHRKNCILYNATVTETYVDISNTKSDSVPRRHQETKNCKNNHKKRSFHRKRQRSSNDENEDDCCNIL